MVSREHWGQGTAQRNISTQDMDVRLKALWKGDKSEKGRVVFVEKVLESGQKNRIALVQGSRIKAVGCLERRQFKAR